MSSDFQELRVRIPVHIHPSRLGRLRDAVHESLNHLLMTYREEFQGVILAYEAVEACQDKAVIFYSRPHLHFDVEVTLLAFCPTINSILMAEVNKVGSDHIGCLVHGAFNLSITADGIPLGYTFQDDSWVCSNAAMADPELVKKHHKISQGSRIAVRVIGLHINDHFLLTGSLRNEPSTSHESNSSANNHKEEKKSKEKQKRTSNIEESPTKTIVNTTASEPANVQKDRKRKKHKEDPS